MLEHLPENLMEQAVVELKHSDIPVFIFGGAKLARKIKQFLDDRGIEIQGFLINRKYWDDTSDSLYGCPVYVFEDYLVHNRCNLIVAFAGFDEAQITQYRDQIHKLYVLDFIGALCMEHYYNSLSKEFYQNNIEKFQWVEDHLCDEKSKRAYEAFIVQRMSGRYSKEEYESDQYFPDDIICLKENEVFVDCGAYQGESAVDFIAHMKKQGIKKYKKIICVEADRENAEKMQEAMGQYENVEIVFAGVWDKTGHMSMVSGYGRTSRIVADGADQVRVETIDSLLQGEEATYIKMDVEGSELKALYGAEKTIREYKPKLAICMYHKPEDLIEIPAYINTIRNDYKFYVRNHSQYGIETVLYAV